MATRPSRADLASASGKTIPDLIAPNLKVLFCGINPSLYTAYTGHHFARPGNRFWPALYASGFTDTLLSPAEEEELLKRGLGITSLVERPTTGASELTSAELKRGGQKLIAKVETYRPQVVAILGISAYRTAFDRPQAALGRQSEKLATAELWVLPNPSGLNAHYAPADLARVYRDFRLQIEANDRSETDR
jgi:TDG/mug DNA glycosylase family protein